MNNLTTTLNIAIVRNKLTNNMAIEERVLHYTRRNSYGRLIFPHCVRAHIDEIMLYVQRHSKIYPRQGGILPHSPHDTRLGQACTTSMDSTR